jgi:hypothetical protein
MKQVDQPRYTSSWSPPECGLNLGESFHTGSSFLVRSWSSNAPALSGRSLVVVALGRSSLPRRNTLKVSGPARHHFSLPTQNKLCYSLITIFFLSDLVTWILGGLLCRVLASASWMTWSLYGGSARRTSRRAPERSTHHMMTAISLGSLGFTWCLYRDLLHGPSQGWHPSCVSSSAP